MATPTGSAWINQIFEARAAQKGGIVRRKVATVHKYASFNELEAAVKAREFHMVKTGGQYLIFCHKGDFKMIC